MRTPIAIKLVGLVFLVSVGWSKQAAAQGFVVSTTSGLEAVRANHPADWWLSGAGLIDLDGDGDLNLFLSSHGSYGSLTALNDGTGHFTLATGTFPNSELLLPADVNNDGKIDFSATYADGGAQWWINVPMPGLVSFNGSNVIRQGNTARQQALMDTDGDGKIDWLRGAGAGVLIDKGDGMGGFQEASSMVANPGGQEISIVPVDIDGDGDQDMFVEYGRYDSNGPDGATRLYRNDGGGVFTDITTAAGLYESGFAIQGVGDFDQDGDTDIIALEHRTFPHSIFLNDGQGHFTKKDGAVTGLASGKPDYASWGLAAMTDFDNDGIPDIIVDGRFYLHVLRGTGGGAFVYANQTWGGIVDTAEATVDNGFTFGDIDGDGDLDLIGYQTTSPRTLNVYVNQLPPQAWINVRPVGLPGNHPAAGAEIRIYEAGTTQLLWFEEMSLYSKQVEQTYYAFGDTERHYGLGAHTSVDVTVRFHPSNKVVRQDGVAANTTVRIGEDGAGTIVPPPPPSDGGAGGGSGPGGGGTAGGGTSGGGASGAAGASGAPHASGGGGCGCAVGEAAWAGGSASLALLALASVIAARRRRQLSAPARRD